MTDAGLLGNWSKKTGEAFTDVGSRNLENPLNAFDHALSGTAVKGFHGQLDDTDVVFFVYKEGPGSYCSRTYLTATDELGAPLSSLRTRDVLRVFHDGTEVPGVLAYGYWAGADQSLVGWSGGAWPTGTVYLDRWFTDWNDQSRRWHVLERQIVPPSWPKPHNWHRTLLATLKPFLENGAAVTWCGGEGMFVDPPAMLEPHAMAASAWAMMDSERGFQCSAELDGEFKTLSISQVKHLVGMVK